MPVVTPHPPGNYAGLLQVKTVTVRAVTASVGSTSIFTFTASAVTVTVFGLWMTAARASIASGKLRLGLDADLRALNLSNVRGHGKESFHRRESLLRGRLGGLEPRLDHVDDFHTRRLSSSGA